MKTKVKGIPLSVSSIVSRDANQEFSLIDDEVIMLSLEKGEYFALNEVASRIWELIDKPISVDKLTELLMEEYDICLEECIEDTLLCLSDFLEKEIITVHSD